MTLSVNSNSLTGILPIDLGRMIIFSNSTPPTVTCSMGRCRQSLHQRLAGLIEVWVQDNVLTGTLPSSLGQITALEFLVVKHNQFDGTLPRELGNLTRMITMTVSMNAFTGTLPAKLSRMTACQELLVRAYQLFHWNYSNSVSHHDGLEDASVVQQYPNGNNANTTGCNNMLAWYSLQCKGRTT